MGQLWGGSKEVIFLSILIFGIIITVNVLKFEHQKRRNILNLFSLLTIQKKGSNKFCKGRQFKFTHILWWMSENEIYISFKFSSAADLYIKDFLHPYVMEGNLDARPLRILYRHRWIQTVPETVLQYCIQEMTGPLAGSFRAPTEEDIQKHRVVITTLSTARLLSDLDLPVGE